MISRKELRDIVEGSSARKARIFDYTVLTFIIFSLLSFAFETLPDLSVSTVHILKTVEIIFMIIFTIEYLIRIYASEKPLRYIFSFYGLIDLIAVLPFYLSMGLVDSRSFRIFRMFRIFRLLNLMKYNKAMRRFYVAFLIAKEELVLFLLLTLMLLFSMATGIFYFEHAAQPDKFTSIFHCLWWALVTLTTVGYGDIVPITAGGQLFTFFTLIVGIGVITIPAGLIASALTKAREVEDQSRLKERTEKLK